MTGNTALMEFNQFFALNYQYLKGFAYLIKRQEDAENLLHDAYLRCYKRIDLSGFSGQTFLNFIRVTMTNANRNHHRDSKDNVEFTLPDSYECDDNLIVTQDYSVEIENKLLQLEQDEQQQREYDNDVSYKHTMAFEYVDKYFTEKDKMVFKTYYVLKHKHLNYKQLALATNMSQSSVSNIIKHIKKVLRVNLMCYISTGLNIMELQEKVLKVEALLQKDLRHNLGEYKSYYLLIFGKGWSGCGCNLNQIRESLKSWLVKSKAELKAEQDKLQ